MVDREILATRLSRLREVLGHLKRLAEKTREEYLSSETDRALAEHYLRIGLEATLDAGNHVIAAEGFRKPLQLRDVPLILTEEPSDRGRSGGEAGARRRFAEPPRSWIRADRHGRIHEILRGDLSDLETFAVAIGSRYANRDKD